MSTPYPDLMSTRCPDLMSTRCPERRPVTRDTMQKHESVAMCQPIVKNPTDRSHEWKHTGENPLPGDRLVLPKEGEHRHRDRDRPSLVARQRRREHRGTRKKRRRPPTRKKR